MMEKVILVLVVKPETNMIVSPLQNREEGIVETES